MNSQNTIIAICLVVIGTTLPIISIYTYDPLPSWNDTKTKQSILNYIDNVENPFEERIAVFDLDGTLWVEKPLWNDVTFHLLDDNTEEGDWNAIMTAYDNIDQDEYIVKSAEYLRDNPPKVYKPMIELIKHLKNNQFEVYIVTGASAGFARSVSEDIFGIPMQNVIGTHPEYYFNNNDGVLRKTVADVPNLGSEKVINIQKHIGRMPLFACGNSDGDKEMLIVAEYSCIIDHDDIDREYKYKNELPVWRTHVSMKNDFKTIFE